MDGQKVVPQSLIKELIRLLFIATIAVSLLAGLIAGLLAFDEAREMQDEILAQIARTISDDTTSSSNNWTGHQDDSNIIVQPIQKLNKKALDFNPNQADGFVTIDYGEASWRAYLVTTPSKQRFIVAQQTELRDEIAWASAASAMLPIFVMAAILLIAITWIIWSRMQPIKQLARKVDYLSVDNMNPLPVERIPSEVTPFIEAINRLLVRASDTIKHQRRFIADASHELRTPVAALTLQADNVRAADSDTEREQRFQLLHQSLIRLNTLVNQLLKLARLRNVGADTFNQVDADEVLKDIVASLYPLAENKVIDLGVTESVTAHLNDFNGGLSQLFENAISNAIYYTPDGGQVDVSLTVLNGNAIFKVIDTGPGIDEQYMDKVFTPFYRVEGNTESGSGLGLAICSEIAQQLKGKISLANREQGGLEFTYTQKLTNLTHPV